MGKRFKEQRLHIKTYEAKVLIMLFLVEIVFLLYAVYRGIGAPFFRISLAVIPLSLISYAISFKMQADKYLVIISTLLLNIGFIIQMLSGAATEKASLLKCIVAFAAAYVSAFAFTKLADFLARDKTLPVLIGVQTAFCIVLELAGDVVTSESDQGAKINIAVGGFSFQPLEIVKIIYIFVIVTALCKREREDKRICGVPREWFLLVYTAYIACWMVNFSEYGTMLIILAVMAVMMFIYSSNRQLVWKLAGTGGVSAVLGWMVLSLINPSGGQLGKLYKRLKYFLHPEQDYLDSGYQAVLARKALTVGGLLGPDTERYIFDIPMQENDFIFAKLVQTCGLVMGILLILTMVFFLHRGLTIAKQKEDTYFSGLAVGITLLVSIEAALHIGYNIGILPITGIPLYLVSQGFTATTTGMMMVAVLLVLSTDKAKRSVKNERKIKAQK